MNKMLNNLASLSFLSAMLIFATPVSPVFAAEEMTIDDYIDEARPYLHLSCESAWEATGEDKEEYVAIINKFVAIVFINHNFDVSRLEEAPEADQEQLRVIFYNKIGEQCRDTPQALLAGVVESSLVYAFDEMKPKTE
jgi:hypothetical protein